MTEMNASDGGTMACSCGLTFATVDELDQHFYDVFVPADDTGLDGKRHAEIDRAERRRNGDPFGMERGWP